jgi:chromosome segregation ATPase
LKEELVSEKKKFDEKDALNNTEKEELKETIDKLVKAAGEEVLSNQNLQEKLKAAEETIKEIRKSKEEFEVLANDHLRERNFRVKEAESKEQEILGLKKVVDDKNNLIIELELKCEEVDKDTKLLQNRNKNTSGELTMKVKEVETLKKDIAKDSKEKWELLQKMEGLEAKVAKLLAVLAKKDEEIVQLNVKSKELQKKEDESRKLLAKEKEVSQGQLCIAKNLLTEENQESRKEELESTKPEEKNDPKNRVQSVQEEIKKNQSLFPKAGSSEIIRRSIKSFCCLENFLVVECGLFECTIKVVKSVSGIEQLSPFKGTGKSKKKAKNDAFDSYLSSIMSCI